ncbi:MULTISPECIES: hypothetical protein [unclassified Minwuia]|jgi:LPS-assembly lipoprotein|uniref:hypothetical protein n=1 Tax=unclassified Minwuia TaxID=2618799 RepID=UPI00247853E7|nr:MULTISPECIES: hypothetical protein [unclassified Minwuia]
MPDSERTWGIGRQAGRARAGAGGLSALLRTGLLGLVLVCAACGFEPVYAPGGGSVADSLRTVSVDQPPGRIGQAMRLAILYGIGDRQSGIQPKYRLRSQMRTDTERVAIQADESAARVNVIVNVSWQLQDAAGLTTYETGQVRRTVAYNVVADTFATLVGQRDAERLAGKQVGEAIRTRLLLALRDR